MDYNQREGETVHVPMWRDVGLNFIVYVDEKTFFDDVLWQIQENDKGWMHNSVSVEKSFYCVLIIYCVLNNNTFKLFLVEHILVIQDFFFCKPFLIIAWL